MAIIVMVGYSRHFDQHDAYGTLMVVAEWEDIAMSADGSIRLAVGVSTPVWISRDSGDT